MIGLSVAALGGCVVPVNLGGAGSSGAGSGGAGVSETGSSGSRCACSSSKRSASFTSTSIRYAMALREVPMFVMKRTVLRLVLLTWMP